MHHDAVRRDLPREAFGAHEGVEVDTQGDSFFVGFRRPTVLCGQPRKRWLYADG
jgi:hypothetical protein